MEDYPYNLLIAARGTKMLALPLSLTKDVYAGIAYALFTLDETEQNVLEQKFRMGMPITDEQQQIERKALTKLCHPSRWNYICYGVVGYGKQKAEEARRRGFEQGYQEGYAIGVKAKDADRKAPVVVDMMDLPIETMPLSSRVCNALRRNGCRSVRDVAAQNIETIQRIRNLGSKGIQEVLQVLRSYGLTHTEWELY